MQTHTHREGMKARKQARKKERKRKIKQGPLIPHSCRDVAIALALQFFICPQFASLMSGAGLWYDHLFSLFFFSYEYLFYTSPFHTEEEGF